MSYGITTDILGFAAEFPGVTLQGVTDPVRSPSEAKANDSNGDVVAETLFDTTNGQQRTVSYKATANETIDFYTVDTGTSRDYRLGKVIGGYVITGKSISTTNTDFADIQFTIQKTASLDTAVSKYNTGITFNGGKGARKFGFTKDTATRLTGSSVSAQVGVARSLDSLGQEKAIDVSEGRIDATHNLTGVTGVCGGAADTGWTLLGGPSNDETNTGYETGSAVVFKNIIKT